MAALASLSLGISATPSTAQTLVGSEVFVTGFDGWTDTFTGAPQAGTTPKWGVLLTGTQTLTESSDGRAADGTTTGGVADGLYRPFLLIDTADVTPATYDLSAAIGTFDNDGFGLAFGYQDNDNYFRVGWREQAGSSVGFPEGISVQKVVGGTITQLATDPTVLPIVDGILSNLAVAVDGSNWAVTVDGNPVINGSDADLQPGNYGVFSWGQRQAAPGDRLHGTVVDTVSVSSGTLNKTTTFSDALSPVPWRPLMMTNADGVQGSGADDFGNFRQDFRNGTIQDDSNGFEWATTTAPNIDFIGPGVVVDEPGSASWTDYRMNVRMNNGDDDAISLLMRVADDDSFYRITFSTQGLGSQGHERAPLGMSIQKNDNGTWSELFRDDQTNPQFLFADSVPFDVSVAAVGNAFKIDVIDDPEGAANVISYAPIVDSTSPILAGSVGLANWGSGGAGNGVTFSSFGGGNTPLLTVASAVAEFQLSVDRDDGSMMLINNSLEAIDVSGYTITSTGGALRPEQWMSIAENYDQAPGDGSVDASDSWAETVATDFELNEEEQPANDGGRLVPGQMVDLGMAWTKSQIEDVTMLVELADGSSVPASIDFIGGPGDMPYGRSDLNADGQINLADWMSFFPNTLADLSSLSAVEAALAGDLDLDGDNDVDDFSLFKADYDAANGTGAFVAMLARTRVPEPSTIALVILAAVGAAVLRGRSGPRVFVRIATMLVIMVGMLAFSATSARAVPLDFTTFALEAFPQTNGPIADWMTTPSSATVGSNASINVFLSQESALNKRFIGELTPGGDDDMVGFVLGFEPGDADFFNLDALSADYLLIDWKGVEQNFDFDDSAESGIFFHTFTTGGIAPVGLALSRVNGIPTADEMWQHVPDTSPDEFEDNPDGGVTELARGVTLGSSPYPRDGSSVLFDITYTPTNVRISVDGVEQFNVNGSFPAGNFGLYTLNQQQPTFSNFEVLSTDFTGLSATVDRADGTITLDNDSAEAFEIDYYEIASAGSSLNATIGMGSGEWTSFNSTEGDTPGVGWDEAGGSSSRAIAELHLDGAATIAGNASLAIGQAYNPSVNAEDLVLRFRLSSGLVLEGAVNYIGEPPAGLAGDYNNNGVVDAADYVVWRNALGTSVTLPNDATPGMVGAADYDVWVANFGNMTGATSSAVPEPSAWILWGCALALAGMKQLRRW